MSGPDVLPEHVNLVLSALHGRDARNPVTKTWLSMSTGLAAREVEATISAIRAESIALVASSGEGYWLPGSLSEAEANIERRHSRAIRQMTTLQGERALIARMRDAENPRPTLWAVSA